MPQSLNNLKIHFVYISLTIVRKSVNNTGKKNNRWHCYIYPTNCCIGEYIVNAESALSYRSIDYTIVLELITFSIYNTDSWTRRDYINYVEYCEYGKSNCRLYMYLSLQLMMAIRGDNHWRLDGFPIYVKNYMR